MNKLNHFLKIDYRLKSLNITTLGLVNAIEVLKQDMNQIEWYDVDWFMEESEPIYGLAFISFQNYINGTVKDIANKTSDKVSFYKLSPSVTGFTKSKIELIIGLANYAKHKDDGVPHKGTKEILECFNLGYQNISYLDKSAIFQGLTILHEDWNLLEIMNIVVNWRNNIWNENFKLTQ